MALIQPSIFSVLRRFPDHRCAIRHLYRRHRFFRTLCGDYQRCTAAIAYWADSEHRDAVQRCAQYRELLAELTHEIEQTVYERMVDRRPGIG